MRPAASRAPDFGAPLARWPGAETTATPLVTRSGAFPGEVVVNVAVLVVLLGYVLVVVANRLEATTTARREGFRTLLRLGATPGRLRRMSLGGRADRRGRGRSRRGAGRRPADHAERIFLGRPWPAEPSRLVPACVLLVGAMAWLATVLSARRAYTGGG
ncbi:hypothetical protein [Nonomuraea sp. NPDC050691]|uniref:hypothetical protein n=1 Tax=Nonomuraea sp. NPDC050691 TaxID=3155661 RepID=UPI0033D87072